MPVIIPENLISKDILNKENIFTIKNTRASSQDIRPLKIGIVNLMPRKEVTEIQLLRLLSNTSLQIDVDLIRMDSYEPKNSSKSHLERFYKTYEDIKEDKYDGLIVTGAPLEKIEYQNIKYWEELTKIFEFAKKNVFSTMFICWSAQAALKYFYNIDSVILNKKIFGVYEFEKASDDKLLKGFDDIFYVPTSRYSYAEESSFIGREDLEVLSSRDDTGIGLAKSLDGRFIFNFGHLEYDKQTLHEEYLRDQKKGLDTDLPSNYYKDNNPQKDIVVRWKSSANLLFSNWLNYYVYQETPYNIEEIKTKSVSKFGGTSLSDSDQFKKVKDIILSKEDRDIIVVSAPGKRFKEDKKVTDQLIKINELNEDIKDLSLEIEKLQRALNNLYEDKGKFTDEVKNRFLEISNKLKLEAVEKIINETFEEIKNSSSKDFIISRGEYLNAVLMAEFLGYKFVDAKDIISFNREGQVDFENTKEKIKSQIKRGEKIVVPGFYGSDSGGNIKTFAIGGSDYTGSIIASVLNSSVYENWTDVNGIMTDDPNKNDKAKTIEYLSYRQLENIIDGGASVYQKDAIGPVKNKNITIKILNTNDPDFKGTEIKDN
ncbi:homoserine O-succinyltransferase [uncultured Peptoniphilus sp.]|uniref:homoserine O-acetyltransferase/O-succinyltransferase family protein n=1 Tax=uncultured Peptoniphilus sp. TaxID=254354 RepID=UPI002803E7C9|nr:homoserine O-succinyltransferase [uncultured Peptoniphilus sp.]